MEVKIDSGAARIRCNGHEMASTGSTKAGLILDWLKQDHGLAAATAWRSSTSSAW
jgi:hypothetical protein